MVVDWLSRGLEGEPGCSSRSAPKKLRSGVEGREKEGPSDAWVESPLGVPLEVMGGEGSSADEGVSSRAVLFKRSES